MADLFDTLFSPQHVPYALVAALVGRGDGLLVQLDRQAQQAIAGEVRRSPTQRLQLRLATPERLRDAVLARRPDLSPVLMHPNGLTWLAGELTQLRVLTGITAA